MRLKPIRTTACFLALLVLPTETAITFQQPLSLRSNGDTRLATPPVESSEAHTSAPADAARQTRPVVPSALHTPDRSLDASDRLSEPSRRLGTRTVASAPACGWEREIHLDPATAPLHLGVETYPQTLQLNDHEVVLTFDDGPAPDTTPQVLRALKDACVHATFFLIGRNAAANPQLARREVVEGHSVGHHSNSHPSFTLRGFDTASAEQDIAAGIAADERAIYGAAARPADRPHTPFFRFPGFADSPALLSHLDAKSIAVFGTDLWAADWLLMTPDYERERILGLLDRQPLHNGIILFHDTKRATAEMLPALLRDLRQRHYTIVHLVYAPGAPAPALTAPRLGPSETERIIAHLPTPIVPGSHHLAARNAEASRRRTRTAFSAVVKRTWSRRTLRLLRS